MKLRISEDLALPLDAVTETFSILGRRGSGKTHTAVVMAEEMLGAGVPVVVIDPLDVWWGLRVSKDGKKAGFPIYVCGGAHQDIPLTADAGRVLADAVVDRGLPMVLSLRHLSKSDQRRFVGEFCERLYDRKADLKHRTALHVFIDEADAFVPQRLMPGAERCFGAVDTMVRRGRSSGLAVTLISQRPQVINKDVLSQTEVLVSHQLTGPQDRKALEAWIEANDTENRRAEFMGSLASLARGRAWFWSPGLLSVFKPVQVRDRKTFDSSATPKAGVTAVASPKAFAEVDIEKLTAEIAATIEKAKADDPRELRKQIAELKAQVAKKDRVLDQVDEQTKRIEQKLERVKPVEKFVLKDGQLARAEKLIERIHDIFEKHDDAFREVAKQLDAIAEQIAGAIRQTRIPPATTATEQRPSLYARRVGLALPQPTGSRPARVVPPPSGPGDASLPKGERIVLTAVAQYPDGAARDQLSILTGYKRSTRDAYLQRLGEKGFVHANGNGITATPAGVDALGSDFEPLPVGAALLEWWFQRLPAGERSVLDVVAGAHPNAVDRGDIDERTGFKRSTRDAYIQRLMARRLVTAERGAVKASDELFD